MRKKDNSSEECPSLETSVNTADDKGCVRRVMRRERKPRNLPSMSSNSEKPPATTKKQSKSGSKKSKTTPKSEKTKNNQTLDLTAGSESESSKKRGRPVKRTERNDSSLNGSVISASARTTADSVLSTKAVVSVDDEPIYIDDEDEENNANSRGLNHSLSEDSDDDSNRSSNLVMDVSPTPSPKKRSRSSSPNREQQTVPTTHVDDVISSVINGIFLSGFLRGF